MPPIIELRDVDVEYPIYQGGRRSLKMDLAEGMVGGLLKRTRGGMRVRALNALSLTIHEGERVGLVGHNGSGKTTLLRLLAGVASPTRGDIAISGRVVPLIDKGLGLNDQFSAEENIELPLRLLGATDAEIREARSSVLEFADLGVFAKLPMRTYSAGMRTRLMFALCTALKADVLLLDEWIGAGDTAFVEKASRRVDELVGSCKALVLASHSLDLIVKVCNRVLWFDHGNIVADGEPEEVSRAYWMDARRKQLEALGIDPSAELGARSDVASVSIRVAQAR